MSKLGRPTKIYVYGDAEGRPAHYKARYQPPGKSKEFRQYRQLSNGDKIYSFQAGWYEPGESRKSWVLAAAGDRDSEPPSARAEWFPQCQTYLYRYPEILRAIADGRDIWLFEGEKDADRAAKDLLDSTTTTYGAGKIGDRLKWDPTYTDTLAQARVVKVVVDNDLPGYRHALMIESLLTDLVPLEFYVVPDGMGKDYSDLRDNKGTVADLVRRFPGWFELEVERMEAAKKSSSAAASGDSLAGEVSNGEDREKGEGEGAPAGLDEPKATFPKTDLGNARRFIHHFGSDLRYCPQTKQWLVWNGSIWKADETQGEPILKRWMEVLPELDAEHSMRSQSQKAIDSMTGLARRLPGVPVMDWELNREAHLLPVANGVIDLRSGELVENSKSALFTLQSPVVYDPEAKCPLWEAEMKRAHGNEDDDPFADDMVDFIQRVCGYILTGETYMKHFFFIYGPSNTGKSQIVSVLDTILGEWAGTVAPEKLMRRRQEGEIPEHWAGVRHCRFVQVPEVKSGDTLDEGLIQRLTGGDKVTARFMRENTFEYRPVSKFVMTGNYQPNIVTQNEAMWGRMMLIPYMKVIEEKSRIGDYWKVVLQQELPGILAWMVRGAVKFYEDGYRRPDEVKDLIREYRDEQDVVGTFIRSRCVLLPDVKSGPYELYEAFREFQGKRGEFKWPLKTFSQAMAEQEDRLKKLRRDKGEGPVFEKRRSGSSGARVYHGIALKPAAMMEDEVEY